MISAIWLFAVPDVRAVQRPNFVVIQTDDMTLQMMKGSFRDTRGVQVPIMPRLKALVGDPGMEFQNAYTPSPVCSPSRASLFSGQLPHNHGVVVVEGPFGGWQGWLESPRMEPNLATVLDASGYHMAHFGKWMNNYGEDSVVAPAIVPPGWDTWASDATDRSTRDYYGYFQLVRNEREGIFDEIRGPYGSQTYRNDQEVDPAWCDVFSQSTSCNYHADRMNALAATEIRESDEPFFVMVDHHGPHGDQAPPSGPQPATRHLGLARNAVLPRPPHFDEKNTTDKDFLTQQFNGRLGTDTTRIVETIWKRSIESLQAIDEGIELIHRALRESGKLPNTYFVFTSDNGYFHGEHRFSWGKGLPYEESAKVPLLIAGPGIEPGTTSTPVSQLDLAPTILDLAGLEPGGMEFDGQSLEPYLEGSSAPDRAVVIERLTSRGFTGDPGYPPEIPVTPLDPAREGGKSPNLFYRGIRIGPYKYFAIDSGGEELYDLERDPFELYNQVGAPGYAEVLEFMRSKAAQYRECVGEECLAPPGTPPKPGVLLTDAKPPPAVVGMDRAFHFGQTIYATVACPARARKACVIDADARRSGVKVTDTVRKRLGRGVKVRIALPVLPGKEIEVLRLSERGKRNLVIRTAIQGGGSPQQRTVEFLQR